jgi:hypothetical protein
MSREELEDAISAATSAAPAERRRRAS